MFTEQKIPTLCPLCQSNSLEKLLGETLLAAHISGAGSLIPELVTYRCDNGHIFLVLSEDFEGQGLQPEGNGWAVLF